MSRWFIGTMERRAQVLDIASDGTPTAIYNSQLVPGGSAQFWSAWSPDGGTTIYLGGSDWGGDSACLWKSIDGGLTWNDAAGDAGAPGELPAPYHGDNCWIRAMYGIDDGIFYASIESWMGDRIFKYDNGVWSVQRDSGLSSQNPSQMCLSTAGFMLATKYKGWQPASLEHVGYDNFFDGAFPTKPLGVWYRPDNDKWYVLNMFGATPECWEGTPYVPTADDPNPGYAGAGTWALDHAFVGMTRNLDDGSNVLWGDADGNLYTVLDAGVDCEVWKRDKDTDTWGLDYTIVGAGNYAGGIWGTASGEILACAAAIATEFAAFRTGDGVWSTIDLSALFGFAGLFDNAQGIWGFSEPSALVYVEEGYGTGLELVLDGYFRPPYDNDSSIVFSNADGYDGYNITIVKTGDLALGQITVNVTVDGYDDPINISPDPNGIDVPRSSSIGFRIRNE